MWKIKCERGGEWWWARFRSGSGSGKMMRILWIRIRICNTALNQYFYHLFTLSGRSGTTVLICFIFSWTLHAWNTINNWPIILKSSLLDSALSQLSAFCDIFIIAFLQLLMYSGQFFLQKKFKKICALLKNRNLYSNYFRNAKWYWKNSNGFKLQSTDSSWFK